MDGPNPCRSLTVRFSAELTLMVISVRGSLPESGAPSWYQTGWDRASPRQCSDIQPPNTASSSIVDERSASTNLSSEQTVSKRTHGHGLEKLTERALKTDKPIGVSFGVWTRVGSKSRVLDGALVPGARGSYGKPPDPFSSTLNMRRCRREPCKNGWTDRYADWNMDSWGPKEPRVGSHWCNLANVSEWSGRGGNAALLSPVICILQWSLQSHCSIKSSDRIDFWLFGSNSV